MRMIGIHDGHTAAAALMDNGVLRFALQEERLVREKNAGGFPRNAIDEILRLSGLQYSDIDFFVFSGNEPQSSAANSRKSVLEKYAALFSFNPPGIVRRTLRFWRAGLGKIVPRSDAVTLSHHVRALPLLNSGISFDRVAFIDHHECHAAAAAFGWGKQEKFLVVTSDAAGDGLAGSISLFENGVLKRVATIDVKDSVARLYSLLTYYMGMVPMEHEYKIMGLAPYAESSPEARDTARYLMNLFEFSEDGLTYRRKHGVEPTYFFGPRLKSFLAFKRFDTVSAGFQLFIEQFVSEWVRRAMVRLEVGHVAFSGGLFMNVKLNKIISELEEVEDMFVFPSCGDESNVFGALYAHYRHVTGKVPEPLSTYYLGGEFPDTDIQAALDQKIASGMSCRVECPANMAQSIAQLLADKGIVARFAGKMEFGARALGNRSILANPSDPGAVRTINKMIKSRDFWMPFAPSLLSPDRYILNPKCIKSPYMMLAFATKPEKVRSIEAALHPYDHTCRAQIVDEEDSPQYAEIIRQFERLTSESVLLNTSFNLHGYPVVYRPEEALDVFERSGLKHLAIGGYLVHKS